MTIQSPFILTSVTRTFLYGSQRSPPGRIHTLVGAEPPDLLLMNTEKWCDFFTYMLRLQKTVTSILLALSCLLTSSLWWNKLPSSKMHCGEGHAAKDQKRPPQSVHEELRSLSNRPKELNCAKSHMSEPGSGSFPVEPQDDCSLWNTQSQRPQLSCTDFWPKEPGR